MKSRILKSIVLNDLFSVLVVHFRQVSAPFLLEFEKELQDVNF